MMTTVKVTAEQLVNDIKAKISNGELRPGDKLPSLDAIVADHKVARATVVKAYTRLQTDGYAMADFSGTVVIDRGAWMLSRIRDYLNDLEAMGRAPRTSRTSIRTKSGDIIWDASKNEWTSEWQ